MLKVSGNNLYDLIKRIGESKISTFLLFVYSDQIDSCKEMKLIVEEVSEKYKNELKVGEMNFPENLEVCQELKIKKIPTLIIYKDGDEKTRLFLQLTISEIIDNVRKISMPTECSNIRVPSYELMN